MNLPWPDFRRLCGRISIVVSGGLQRVRIAARLRCLHRSSTWTALYVEQDGFLVASQPSSLLSSRISPVMLWFAATRQSSVFAPLLLRFFLATKLHATDPCITLRARVRVIYGHCLSHRRWIAAPEKKNEILISVIPKRLMKLRYLLL